LGEAEALGNAKPVLVGKSNKRALVDQLRQERIEIARDRGVIGFRILLAYLLQPPLHRLTHFTVGNFLVADAGQGRASHSAEAHIARTEVRNVAVGKAGEDGDQDRRHNPRADLGIRNSAKEGEHRGSEKENWVAAL